jgi:uncharacterized protein
MPLFAAELGTRHRQPLRRNGIPQPSQCHIFESHQLQDDAVTEIAIVAAEPTPLTAAPWKFWGTTLWGVASLAAFMIAAFVGLVAFFIYLDLVSGRPSLSQEQPVQLLFGHSAALTAIVSVSYVCAAAIVILAVRLSHLSMRDYLALTIPRPSDIVIGLIGMVILYVVHYYLARLLGPSHATRTTLDRYLGARASGELSALAIAVVVVAPVGEEIFVRGFLLRGWAESRLGATGAILLTSLV